MNATFSLVLAVDRKLLHPAWLVKVKGEKAQEKTNTGQEKDDIVFRANALRSYM